MTQSNSDKINIESNASVSFITTNNDIPLPSISQRVNNVKPIKKIIADDGITIEEMQNLLDITEEDLFSTKESLAQLKLKNQLLDKELISVLKHKNEIASGSSYLKDFIENRLRGILEDVKNHLLSNSFYYTVCKETNNNNCIYIEKLENISRKILSNNLRDKTEDLMKGKMVYAQTLNEQMKLLEKLKPDNEKLIERINRILYEEINPNGAILKIDSHIIEKALIDEILTIKIDNTDKSNVIDKLKIKIEDLEKHILVLLSQDVTKENEAFRNNLKKIMQLQKKIEENENENITSQVLQKVQLIIFNISSPLSISKTIKRKI